MERLEGQNNPGYPGEMPSGLPDTDYAQVSSGRLLQYLAEHVQEQRERISNLEQENERLQKLAYTDPLTGLLNRNGFTKEAKAFFEQASPNSPIAIVVLDLDNFKSVNDNFGHTRGDEVLAETANLLSSHVRESDRVASGLAARIGGDEFLMVADLTPRDEQSTLTPEERADRLKDRLANKFNDYLQQSNLAEVGLGISIGSALCRPGVSFQELFDEADRDMYNRKRLQ